jgi:hypothetical protein
MDKAKVRTLVAAGWFLAAAFFAPSAGAQGIPEELLVRGVSWDLQLEGGGGLGLNGSLDDNFIGRIRAGGLLADEPWIFNLGVTGELGGLASRGVGAALEVNHFGGPWIRAGASYVRGDAIMSRASLGFAIFSVEWQHRFRAWEPDDALMFQVRIPIGIWWFVSRELQKHESAPISENADRPVSESDDQGGAEVGAR